MKILQINKKSKGDLAPIDEISQYTKREFYVVESAPLNAKA